ncbi:hypothetical protein Tco_0313981 [Tanacetum coccineum]
MVNNKDPSIEEDSTSLYKSVKANIIASKVVNINGKFLPRHFTTYQEPLKDASSSKDSNQSKESVPIQPHVKPSFAFVVHDKPLKKIVKIKELRSEERVDGAAVVIPLEAVQEVNERFTNTLTSSGMVSVMENGPWLIRLVPLILNEWTPNTILKKDEIKCAPIWVKMHHVPIVAYSEGRSTYATALIEISADVELQKSMVIAIPLSNMSGRLLDVRLVRRVDKGESTGGAAKPSNVKSISMSNSFSILSEEDPWNQNDNNEELRGTSELNIINESDNEDIDKGMNLSPKQNEVRQVIFENNLSVCAILESHVAESNLDRMCKFVFNHWDWVSNAMTSTKGTRIIVGWNRNDVDVTVIHQESQAVHTRIWLKVERKELFFSFIYAHNRYIHRRSLWNGLCLHYNYIRNRPWCLLGDFNASLFIGDTSTGSSALDIAMREFKECVDHIEVVDVQSTGLQYTWNQKPKGTDGILKKLDRVMANIEFLDSFVGAHAVFKPYRISDHSPSVLSTPTQVKVRPRPFKFFNVITLNARKLKYLKKPLHKLMYKKGNLHGNVIRLRAELDQFQTDLDRDPSNVSLREGEAEAVLAFNEVIVIEEKFLKQKAKITNSAYFHKAVKSRISRSRIDVVTDTMGAVFHNDDVAKAFINHYEVFLCQPGITHDFNAINLFSTYLTTNEALDMVRPISSQEIKEAMFSMGNDKSPGSDGFTAAFFKSSWDIIGSDVSRAVREFFINGRLLKELNHTIIALIPKVNSPARVNDYRSISCCNVLFKCISKIIANRIKESLKRLISPNQSAFVPGRSISDNILLTQEIMHNYHLDRGVPRCAFKVDIQKAYDTVDWDFLRKVLIGFGFHDRMVSWIMECVSTTSFSININGSLHGYFKGRRGLRQGDPLSPYIFTLVMEVLTLMLHRRVRESSNFTYHRYCSKLDLINLCFADDLFLFAHGDVNSAMVIKEALDEFKDASGLIPSMPKSTDYFCNVLNHTKLSILHFLPFEEGRIPVKYLGVPLVSSRLIFRDYKDLIEKVQNRINDWKNNSLSIAGRLQLIQSVMGSMHVFWASVFMLPSCVLLDIEQLMRGFLWCQGSMRNGNSKVAWEVVCLPKDEGGLGIRRLEQFNKALMVSHIWKLLSLKESLCVKWIHVYKLKARSFWDIPYRGNMTWGWRKILQLRPLIQSFIWSCIGDGSQKFFVVLIGGVLLVIYLVSYHLGTSLDAVGIFLFLPRNEKCDYLEWRDNDGVGKPFSVYHVWNSIRPRDNVVPWADFVWFRNCIPRHAFNMWLIIKKLLKTQDSLCVWDVAAGHSTVCSLCETQPDSHEHLFFECAFSQQIWMHLKKFAGLSNSGYTFDSIMTLLLPVAKRKASKSTIGKLVIAAAAYFIWQERNRRLFKNTKRSAKDVIECVMSSVRMKLLSCHFKKSKDGLAFARLWELPSTCFK